MFILEQLKDKLIDKIGLKNCNLNKICDSILNGTVKVDEQIWRHVIERVYQNSSLNDD